MRCYALGKKSDVDALSAKGILFSFVSVAIKELTDEKMKCVGKVWHENEKGKEVLVHAPAFDDGGRSVFIWMYREEYPRGVSFKGIFRYGYGDDGYRLWGTV